MMRLVFVLLLAVSIDPIETAKINALKKKAEYHFQAGNYNEAVKNYRMLIDSMNLDNDRIALNLAHAYMQLDDTAQARTFYTQASMSEEKKTKSIAYQQLGVLSKKPETLNESLQYLKASLKADPGNLDARYDYEVVKKLLEKQKEQQQNKDENQKDQEQEDKKDQDQENQQNKDDKGDQQKKDQEQQEQDKQQDDQEQKSDQQKEGEQKEGDEKNQEQQKPGEENKEKDQKKEMSTSDKLKEMNISQEKAQMILEAMRNAEVQYLQQQKRKATERPKSGKPDW